MKTFLVSILAALAFCRVSAQVNLELAMDQEQFLPGESIPVAVKITNRSGERVHFGVESNWLTFTVESADGPPVVKNAEVPVAGDFDLESSQMGIKRVDLQPYFALNQAGRYKVTATLRIHDWAATMTSPAKGFDVIHGALLWEQEFGVPDAAGGAPQMRKYTLEEANYLREQLRLYARVTDAAGPRVFKVTVVAPMVSFSQPEAQVDQASHLHVLCQSGAQAFAYVELSPAGDVVRRETYDYINSRPRLKVNDRGAVVVAGGVLRTKPSDLPVVKLPNELPPPGKP